MPFRFPRGVCIALVSTALCLPAIAHAGKSSHAEHSPTHSTGHAATHSGPSGHTGQHGHEKASGVKRDSHGKIARSPQAKSDFRKSNPCPGTGKTYGACPGYVIDHRQALKHGGADSPSNMQWQTRAAAKAKDKVE